MLGVDPRILPRHAACGGMGDDTVRNMSEPFPRRGCMIVAPLKGETRRPRSVPGALGGCCFLFVSRALAAPGHPDRLAGEDREPEPRRESQKGGGYSIEEPTHVGDKEDDEGDDGGGW